MKLLMLACSCFFDRGFYYSHVVIVIIIVVLIVNVLIIQGVKLRLIQAPMRLNF